MIEEEMLTMSEYIEKLVEKLGIEDSEQLTLGRRNKVFKFNDEGIYYTAKIYKNKYFPHQMEHESGVLQRLPEIVGAPKMVETGMIDGKNYMIETYVEGTPFFNRLYKGYEKDAASYLKTLHSQEPDINTFNVDSDHEEVLEKVVDALPSELKRDYSQSKFEGSQGFIHFHPHFRHFIKNDSGLYLVDWEDATYGSIEIDYASFVKDQIELSRPKEEVLSFLEEGEDVRNTINPYLGVLYCIDWYFDDSPKTSEDSDMLNKASVFFKHNSIEDSLGDIYDN